MQYGLRTYRRERGRVEVKIGCADIGTIRGTSVLVAVPPGAREGQPVGSVEEGAERLAGIYIEQLEARKAKAVEALKYYRRHNAKSRALAAGAAVVTVASLTYGTWLIGYAALRLF